MEENNNLGFGLLGGLGLIGTIWNTIASNQSQQREFEQQEYLMDKQNEYNDPSNQMARMKAAGINPNAAAQQIAANSASASPAQVPTNTANVASAFPQAAAAAAELYRTPSEVGQNEANAGFVIAETETENATRQGRVDELKSIFNLNDSQASLFDLQSQYYISEASSRINLNNAQSDMFRQQIEVYKQQIENYKKDIELIDKKIDSEGWLARMNEYNAYQSKWYYETMQGIGFDPRNPFDSNMFSLAVKFGPDSIEYQRGLSYVQKQLELKRNSDFGLFKAQQKILYDNAINQIDEYMKRELGNRYKGLPADIINDLSQGFGIGAGAVVGSKLGGSPAPVGFRR